MKLSAILSLVIALVTLFVWETRAANVSGCLPKDKAVERLQDHGEDILGAGIAQTGRTLFSIWVSPSGNWTVIRTDIRGMSCVMQSGENWFPAPDEGT